MEENLEKDKAALEGAVVESRLQRGFAVNAGNYAAPTSQKENRKICLLKRAEANYYSNRILKGIFKQKYGSCEVVMATDI